MTSLRFLLILISVIVTLVFGLWLVTTIIQLYETVSLFSPILGFILLILLLGVLLTVVGAAIYYSTLFLRPRRSRARPQAPQTKTDAAEASLQSVRQQVDNIQDKVARQALQQRSQKIEQNFSRRAYHLVVFGTGSAGKTSLINAVMGRMVGPVGAPMGTTDSSQTYPWALMGVNREIWLTDTPGILEAGIAGTEREQEARKLATEADLLIFVIDNDLRQSEYVPLRKLIEMGKRSLLVLNKIDLYTDVELGQLVNQLRQRLSTLVPPEDVIAVAANPRSAQLETGEKFQPEPDIFPLLDRIAAVLRTEGETLIADNILMQAQQLGKAARQKLDAEREQRANAVVDRFQWIGGGVITVTPLPMVDLLATAAVNAQMVVELGQVYGCELSLEQGKALALSLAKTLTSLGLVKGTMQLLNLGLQANLATFLVGRVIQGVSAAYLTRVAGKSFMQYFRQHQDWGDGGMVEVVQEQFNLNRREAFVKAFIQEAIVRMVKPLETQLSNEFRDESED